MEVLFIGLYFPDNEVTKEKRGGIKMVGDVMVILGLALYIPMSMVFMFCRR